MGTQAIMMGKGGMEGRKIKSLGSSSDFIWSPKFLASSNSWLKPQVPLEIDKPIHSKDTHPTIYAKEGTKDICPQCGPVCSTSLARPSALSCSQIDEE